LLAGLVLGGAGFYLSFEANSHFGLLLSVASIVVLFKSMISVPTAIDSMAFQLIAMAILVVAISVVSFLALNAFLWGSV
jgi:hypothetical protein